MFSCFGFRSRHKALPSGGPFVGDLRAPLTPKDGVPLNHHNHHLKQSGFLQHQGFFTNSNRNSFNSTRRSSQISSVNGASTGTVGVTDGRRKSLDLSTLLANNGPEIASVVNNSANIDKGTEEYFNEIKKHKIYKKKDKANKKSYSLPRNINVQKLMEFKHDRDVIINNEKNNKLSEALHEKKISNGNGISSIKSSEKHLTNDEVRKQTEKTQFNFEKTKSEKNIYNNTEMQSSSSLLPILNRSLSPTDLDSVIYARMPATSPIHNELIINSAIVGTSQQSLSSTAKKSCINGPSINQDSLPNITFDDSSIPFIDSACPSVSTDINIDSPCNTHISYKSLIPKAKSTNLSFSDDFNDPKSSTVQSATKNLYDLKDPRTSTPVKSKIKNPRNNGDTNELIKSPSRENANDKTIGDSCTARDSFSSFEKNGNGDKLHYRKPIAKTYGKYQPHSTKIKYPLSYTRLPIIQDWKPQRSQNSSENTVTEHTNSKTDTVAVENDVDKESISAIEAENNILNKSLTVLKNNNLLMFIDKQNDISGKSSAKMNDICKHSPKTSLGETKFFHEAWKSSIGGNLNESFEIESLEESSASESLSHEQFSPLHRDAFRRKKRKSTDTERNNRKCNS